MPSFTIPGEPETWKRMRSNGARRFTDPRAKAAKETVATLYKAHCSEFFDAGVPVAMEVTCYMKPPKRIKYSEKPYPLKKDADNLAKLVMDALNGVAYDDDRQVVSLSVDKYWADTEPRTEVGIRKVGGE